MNRFDQKLNELYHHNITPNCLIEEGWIDKLTQSLAIFGVSVPLFLGILKGTQSIHDNIKDHQAREYVQDMINSMSPEEMKAYDAHARERWEAGGLSVPVQGVAGKGSALTPPVEVIAPKPPVYTFSSTFIEYIKSVENSIKKGLKGGKWYPHDSAEGGNKTIAYGHKLKSGEDFSKGISETEALALLKSDLLAHKNIAEEVMDELHGKDTFKNLSPDRQEMLIDFAFNLGEGGLRTFKNFRAAVVANDATAMEKSYKRYYKDKEGKVHQVKDRNDRFHKLYIAPLKKK